MEWLNYHHLLYFKTVAKEGTVAEAARKLNLARPTVTAQIRQLESAFGKPLFEQRGRRLALTDFGERVLTHAEEIFDCGEDLMRMVREEKEERTERLVVGLPNVLPKLAAHRLLSPVLENKATVQLICREAEIEDLLADLFLHRIDMVISDAPVPPQTPIRTFNHKLGECGITVFAHPDLAKSHRRGFPHSLHEAPFVLPTARTAIRREVDRWFQEKGIRPTVLAEFDDSALMKVFGESGTGLFPAPSIVEKDVKKRHGVEVVGRLDGLREEFHAITLERTIRRAPARSVIEQAQERLFGKR